MPADPHVRPSNEMCPLTRAEKVAMETVPYQQAMPMPELPYTSYAVTYCFTVNQVSRYCHKPRPQNWEVIRNILAYPLL
jgi:hypothetical protein